MALHPLDGLCRAVSASIKPKVVPTIGGGVIATRKARQLTFKPEVLELLRAGKSVGMTQRAIDYRVPESVIKEWRDEAGIPTKRPGYEKAAKTP